ncbi:unnamed protein product [Ectocarpus fasciculatus]
MLGVECLTAPYEADAQLVFMERTFRSQFSRCYIFGNDSDLVVLGAQHLLIDVRRDNTQGTLSGNCISRESLLNPDPSILSDPNRGQFLRSLHGPQGRDGSLCLKPQRVVESRLVNFASVDGNDYFRTRGLGPVTAMDVAFKPALDELELAGATNGAVVGELARRVGAKFSNTTTEGVAAAGICTARWMFKHQVVFDPNTGHHRRLSGLREDSEEASGCSSATGVLSDNAEIAVGAATGEINPYTWAPWVPALPDDGCDSIRSSARTTAARRMDGPPVPESSGRPREMLHEGQDFSRLTVNQLKSALGSVRGLERAGVSGENKATLVNLAQRVVEVMGGLSVTDDNLLFRSPVEVATHAETLDREMPDLPDEAEWLKDHMELREVLPELSETVVIDHLSTKDTSVNRRSRNLYRGMQRVMDLGCLDGLEGVPPPPFGGTSWIRFRTHASMHMNKWYTVHVSLDVHRVATEAGTYEVDEEDAADGDEQESCPTTTSSVHRMVATRVLSALCECQSGAGGSCSHVAMTLQLVRLLKMSVNEINDFFPLTVTGRQCKWILDHCRGGREAENNVWWGKTLPEVSSMFREMRDPKGLGMGVDTETEQKTQGVVSGDRFATFDPHPSGGRWAEPHRHFQAMTTVSEKEREAFSDFFASVKSAKAEGSEGGEGGKGANVLAADVLPARVRPG